MNPQTSPGLPQLLPQSENRKPRILAVAVGAAALIIGVAIGASANSHSAQIASLRSQVSSLKTSLASARSDLSTADSQLAVAQGTAETAQASAQAAAQKQYASKMAAADALLHKLRREQNIVASSTISEDGVYVVGKDIPSGVYHTSGGGECYYATLSSTNTFDIIDNNNFAGPETVDVSTAYAFQIGGGCTWHKVG